MKLWELSIEGCFASSMENHMENQNARVIQTVDTVAVVAPSLYEAYTLAEAAYRSFLRELAGAGFPRNELESWRVVGIVEKTAVYADWRDA